MMIGVFRGMLGFLLNALPLITFPHRTRPFDGRHLAFSPSRVPPFALRFRNSLGSAISGR